VWETQTAPPNADVESDTNGLEDNATGLEGGNVGEEESPEEQQFELQVAENAAPEEGEAEAQLRMVSRRKPMREAKLMLPPVPSRRSNKASNKFRSLQCALTDHSLECVIKC